MTFRSLLALGVLGTSLATSSFGSIAVSSRRAGGTTLYSLSAQNERVDTLAAKIARLGERPIQVRSGGSKRVSFTVTGVPAAALADALARAAHLQLLSRDGVLTLQSEEPAVSLDVKDGEIRAILKSMKNQCGIRNLMIDPDVHGTGTFLFRDVPCSEAFRVVLQTSGLAGEFSGNVARIASNQ